MDRVATTAMAVHKAGRQLRGVEGGSDKMEPIQRFYGWFDSLEAKVEGGKQEAAATFVAKLRRYGGDCAQLLGSVDAALSFLDRIEREHSEVRVRGFRGPRGRGPPPLPQSEDPVHHTSWRRAIVSCVS